MFKGRVAYMLGMMCYITVIVFFYVSLQQIELSSLFNADMIVLPFLYQDIFFSDMSVLGWKFASAPYFFPDMVFYFTLMAVSNNVIFSTVAFGAVQALAFPLLLTKVFTLVRPKTTLDEWVGVPIFCTFVVLSSFLGKNVYDVVINLFVPSTHFGSFLLMLVAVISFLQIRKKYSAWQVLFLGIIVGLAVFSDKLFIVMFVLPSIVTLIFGRYLNIIEKRFSYIVGATVCISTMIAIIGFELLRRILHMGSFPLSLEHAAQSIHIFLKHIAEGFLEPISAMALLTITMTMAWTIRTIWIKVRRGRLIAKHDEGVVLYLVFSTIAVFGLIAAPVVTGIYVDTGSMRYFFHGLLLLLSNSILLYLCHQKKHKYLPRFWVYYAIGIVTFPLFFTAIFFFEKGVATYMPQIAECVDEHADAYSLKYGLSGYWDAKTITMFSKKNVVVHQTNDKLEKYHWNNNIEWYRTNSDGDIDYSQYNFVILDGLDSDAISQAMSIAQGSFMCGESMVYYY